MKVRMNTLWLSRLKPGQEGDYTDTQAKGLQLRVRRTEMVWCFTYKFNGKTKRYTIGSYPEISLAEARKLAVELRARVKKGEDPASEAQIQKSIPSFSTLCREYLEKHAIHKKSKKEDERIITKELIPKWGELRSDTITKRMVISLLDEIVARGSPIMANRTFALVRKIFNWAVSRDILPFSPCAGIKPPAPEQSRDRWLTDEEIRKVWNVLPSLSTTAEAVFKILILTGQRVGEVLSMEWQDLDLENSLWTIPPGKTKNGRSHTVPLVQPVVELLVSLQRKSEWVFPSPKNQNHIASLNKTMKRIKDLSGVYFHIHDLRRTVATGLARLGVPREVIAKILNHSDRSVTAVYERHEYEQEKRHALEKWSNHIMRLAGKQPASVITLPRG